MVAKRSGRLGKGLDQMHEDFAADIGENGYSMLAVGGLNGGGEDDPIFQYTIGLALSGLPELLVLGGIATQTLGHVAREQLAAGRAFAAGEERPGSEGYPPVRFVAVPDRFKEEYTTQAGQHFGNERYQVLQVVILDHDGRFPGEPGCAEPFCHQLDWALQ